MCDSILHQSNCFSILLINNPFLVFNIVLSALLFLFFSSYMLAAFTVYLRML